MEINKFNELMAKYWEGTSSLEEEDQLRSYLRTSEGSSKYPEEAGLFGFFNMQKDIGTSITAFPIEKLAEQEEPKVRKIISFTNVRNIAAALFIVLGALTVWNNYISPSTPETIACAGCIEVDDPKEALRITKEALAFLSNKVDKSERILKNNIAKLSVNKILKK